MMGSNLGVAIFGITFLAFPLLLILGALTGIVVGLWRGAIIVTRAIRTIPFSRLSPAIQLRGGNAPTGPLTEQSRSRASALLSESYVRGALTLSEFEHNMDLVLTARTEAQLSALHPALATAPQSSPAGGPPLAAVGAALALLGPVILVRIVGVGLIGVGLMATFRMRLAIVAFATGLLVLVSIPASLAVGAGGLWSLRREILTPR